MYILNNEIITEAHDYMTTYSGGYKQRTLTPAALEERIALHKELLDRRAETKAKEDAARAKQLVEQRKERERKALEDQKRASEALRAEQRQKGGGWYSREGPESEPFYPTRRT